jgi:hypothetical protein
MEDICYHSRVFITSDADGNVTNASSTMDCAIRCFNRNFAV